VPLNPSIDDTGAGRPNNEPKREARSPLPQILLRSALALCAGVAIAWVDTRPNWDDTGVTAGAVIIAAAASSFARVPFYLAALLIVAPMLIAELHGNAGVLIAIPLALVGAAAGLVMRRLTSGS
jgi:hypothetical protein